jgi:hypothetical protein
MDFSPSAPPAAVFAAAKKPHEKGIIRKKFLRALLRHGSC